MQLLFATHNQNKKEEVQHFLAGTQLQSLEDVGFFQEIEENGSTFEANAQIKVDAVYKKHKQSIFADDSGLVVPSLGGAPGIYSARYAGTGKSEDNIKKLLDELKGKTDRKAYFITVICLLLDGAYFFFEGRVEGTILQEDRGTQGFGYDPVFLPTGASQTFAEMTRDEKAKLSHRTQALAKMKAFLENRIRM